MRFAFDIPSFSDKEPITHVLLGVKEMEAIEVGQNQYPEWWKLVVRIFAPLAIHEGPPGEANALIERAYDGDIELTEEQVGVVKKRIKRWFQNNYTRCAGQPLYAVWREVSCLRLQFAEAEEICSP